MIVAILSDIHGNLTAMQAVLSDIRSHKEIEGFILLGDLIDYGPHSNEVVDLIKKIDKPIICNIYGNHEDAILNQRYDNFSSDRGRVSAKYTSKILTKDTIEYIKNNMNSKACEEFTIENSKCLAVHGSINNIFWGSIHPEDKLDEYISFDYVFSGHSHEPHFFEKYYKIDNPLTRNRKKTIFINPGAVGQPRNLNNCAQYTIFDTKKESISMIKVSYDIEEEMQAFPDEINTFYRDRLLKGI